MSELGKLDKAALIERCQDEHAAVIGLRAAALLALLALRDGDLEKAKMHLSLAAEPRYTYPTPAEGEAAAQQMGIPL